MAIVLGQTTFRNLRKEVTIDDEDRRRHLYIIGKTGMGKTSLLENLAIQDILNGKGLAFIDPHGDAVEDLLNYIPELRIDDVVYFNPDDLDFPIGFNPMEGATQRNRHLICSLLVGTFKKIWPDVWSARMEYILTNTILALLEMKDSTILAIHRMLSDPLYREKVVKKINDVVVKSFWIQEFARYSQTYEVEATAAIQNKVGQFISNPLIRNILGQVISTINIRRIMDEKKIFLINLSKGKIGEENSKLLGGLLISQIYMAAMSRVDIPEEERKDFYLYVDEFQNFATESFINILSEARKYRLNLILAHQYLTQLAEISGGVFHKKVKDAILGNVGTIVLFRLGAEDAEMLQGEFAPAIEIRDILDLPKYHTFVKMTISGRPREPFSMVTLALPEKPKENFKEEIIKRSREKYGRDSREVEGAIASWFEGMEFSLPPKLYDAICNLCGKKTKVPFFPDPNKLVYCDSCLKKIEKEKVGKISLKEIIEKTVKFGKEKNAKDGKKS